MASNTNEISDKVLLAQLNERVRKLAKPQARKRMEDGSAFFVCDYSGRVITDRQEVFSLRPFKTLTGSGRHDKQLDELAPYFGTFAGPQVALRALEMMLVEIAGSHTISAASNLNIGLNMVLFIRGSIALDDPRCAVSLQQLSLKSGVEFDRWLASAPRTNLLLANAHESVMAELEQKRRAKSSASAGETRPRKVAPGKPCATCGLPSNVSDPEYHPAVRELADRIKQKIAARQAKAKAAAAAAVPAAGAATKAKKQKPVSSKAADKNPAQKKPRSKLPRRAAVAPAAQLEV